MRTISWIAGIALVAAAGITVLTSDATADITLPKYENNGAVLDASQTTNAATALAGCWSGSLSEVTGADIYRGTDTEAANIYADLHGWRIVDRATAEAHVGAGGKLGPGRRVPQQVAKCQITGATRLTALQNLATTLWSGSLSTLTRISLSKVDGNVRVNYVVGQQAISATTAVDRSEAGETIEPTGVIQ